MAHNKVIGAHGEDHAAEYLEKNGYTILQRNFRTKYGEIDIIASKNEILYFVEVKTRLSTRFGQPYEAINQRKLHRMELTADIAAKSVRFTGEYKLLLVQIVKNEITLTEIEP